MSVISNDVETEAEKKLSNLSMTPSIAQLGEVEENIFSGMGLKSEIKKVWVQESG